MYPLPRTFTVPVIPEGAAVGVRTDLLAVPTNSEELPFTYSRGTGMALRFAVAVLDKYVAVKTPGVVADTVTAAARNCAELALAATVIVLGTVIAAAELRSETTANPAGTGAARVTVHVAGIP
jgi:hypothetical protein